MFFVVKDLCVGSLTFQMDFSLCCEHHSTLKQYVGCSLLCYWGPQWKEKITRVVMYGELFCISCLYNCWISLETPPKAEGYIFFLYLWLSCCHGHGSWSKLEETDCRDCYQLRQLAVHIWGPILNTWAIYIFVKYIYSSSS